jgi:hypothetical protein
MSVEETAVQRGLLMEKRNSGLTVRRKADVSDVCGTELIADAGPGPYS